MFKTVPNGAEFVWVSDWCHAGDFERDFLREVPSGGRVKTLLPLADIDWRIRTARQKRFVATGFEHPDPELRVALIAGCKSTQTSADAVFTDSSGKERYNGALTYYLLQELKTKGGLTESLGNLVRR